MPQSGHGNDDVEIGKARTGTAKKGCRSKTMIGLKIILVLAIIGMVAFNTFKCRAVERNIRLEMNDAGHLLYSVNKKIDSMNDKISRLEKAVESNEKSLKSKKYSDNAKESDNLQTIQAIHGRINQIVDQRNEDIKAINKRNDQQETEMLKVVEKFAEEINKIVEHMNNNLIFG